MVKVGGNNMGSRQMMRLFRLLLFVTSALCVWYILGYGDWAFTYFSTPRSIGDRYPDAVPFAYRSQKKIYGHSTDLNESELAALVERSKLLPPPWRKQNKTRVTSQNTSDEGVPQPSLPSWVFYQNSLQEDDWVYNRTNVLQFRKELRSINLNTRTHLILSNATTKIGDKLRCYYCKANDTVKVLPWFTQVMPKDPPFVNNKVFKTCSVVGNSGILLNSTCGEEIDQADYVFRCNLAPIAQFGQDAGTRTNLTSMNPSLIWSRYNLLGSKNLTIKFNSDLAEFSGLILATCLGDPSWVKTCQRAMLRFHSETAQMVIGHPEHFRKVWDLWRNKGLRQVISTGFYLTSTALELCDEVNLYGFWPFPYSMPFVETELIRYHYFDKVKAKAETHSMASEFWELWKMHRNGVVKLHISPCNRE